MEREVQATAKAARISRGRWHVPARRAIVLSWAIGGTVASRAHAEPLEAIATDWSRLPSPSAFTLDGAVTFPAPPPAAVFEGDVILTKSATTGTATITSLTFDARFDPVDLTQLSGTTLTISRGTINKGGTNSSTLSGGFLATDNSRFNVNVSAGTLTIQSALTGSNRALNVVGQGTLVLSSTSTAHNLGGGIFVNGGTLRISDDRNLGTSDGNGNPLTLNAGTLEVVNEVTLGAARRLSIGSNGGTVRTQGTKGVLNLLDDFQLVGLGNLTKTGLGTLVIGGKNEYSGQIAVTDGTLELRNPDALIGVPGAPRGSVLLSNKAQLSLRSDLPSNDFLNNITVGNPAAGGGDVNLDFGGLTKGGGQFRLGGLTAFGGNLNLTNSAADGSVLRFAGPVNVTTGSVVNTVGKAVVWLDGQVTGQGALTKSGAGTLYLSGQDFNLNTTLTTVRDGALLLAKAPGVTAIAGNTLIDGGTLGLEADNQIADGTSVTLQAGGFQLAGRNETVAFLTMTGGQLSTGLGGHLTLNGRGPAPAPLPGAPVAAGPAIPLVISGGATTINAGGSIDASAAQISGGANTVQAGGVLIVESGGLTFSGTASPNLTLASDAVNPGQLQLNGNVTFTGTAGTASITTSGGAALPGAVGLNGLQRDVTVNDGSADVDLLVSANVAGGSLRKAGSGKLRLEGANALTGATINAGVLELRGAGALGTGAVALNAGQLNVRSDALTTTFTNALTTADATIDVNRDTPAGGVAGTVEFGALSIGPYRLALQGANRSLRFTGATTLTGGATFEANVATRLSGAIGQSGGTWGLTKEGAGTLTLDGASPNTYLGITRVNAGTLELDKTTGNAVAGDLQVFSGSVRLLRPNQIADAANVTVQNAGTLLDLNNQSETIASLDGATVNSSVSLGAANLTLTQGTYGGVIGGTGRVIQFNPAGGTGAAVVLNGNQSFTGGVDVNHGSVTFSNQAPRHLGSNLTGGAWGVYNGSTLIFNAGSNITTNLATVTLSGAASTFPKFNALANNQGSFTVSGGKAFATVGALVNSGTIVVGGGGSRLTLNGVFTNTGVTSATGAFATTSTINTSGTLTLSGPQSYAPGTNLNVTGGKTTLYTDAGAPGVNNLAVSSTGGTLVLNGSQHLRSLHLGGATVVGAAIAAPTPDATPLPAPVFAATAGKSVLVTQALTTAPAGSLDLATHSLVVDYGGAAGPALATVRDAVIAGYARGSWAGPGIYSSTAAATPSVYGVGYGEASSVLGISGAQTAPFRGETVDATAVLARFTLLGDATLDGAVDFSDLLNLAKNYNKSPGTATWNVGDFDYDQNVGFADLLVLAKNYNGVLPAAPIAGAPVGFDAAVASAFAQVPEPSGLASLSAAACGWALRRHRRRGR